MANWRELYNRCKGVSIEQIFSDALYETQAEFVDKLTGQLEKGISGTGALIGKYKSENYAEYKIQKGTKAPEGYADLKDEGDWYSGLHIEKQTNGGIVKSSDSKDEMLTKKYGEEIKALTDSNSKEYINDSLQPEMLKRLKDALQL